VNILDFEKVTDAFSRFHDAEIERLDFDVRARTLRICITARDDAEVEREVAFEGIGVVDFSLRNDATSDTAFSEYQFPANRLIDDATFTNELDEYFLLKITGTYAWILSCRFQKGRLESTDQS